MHHAAQVRADGRAGVGGAGLVLIDGHFREAATQHGALAAHRFGDEEVPGCGDGRGVELVELDVAQLGARAPRRGRPVARRDRRIGGVPEELAGSAAREHDGVRVDDLVPPVPIDDAHPCHRVLTSDTALLDTALLEAAPLDVAPRDTRGSDDEIRHEGGLAHLDSGVSHRRDESRLDRGPRRVPARVQHAGARVCRLEAAGELAVGRVEGDPEPDELADSFRPLRAQHRDGIRVAEAGPRREGVGRVRLHAVVGRHRDCDPSLRIARVALGELRLCDEHDLVRSGCPERSDQPGDTGSDYDDAGHVSSKAERRASARGRRARGPRPRRPPGCG